MATQNDHFFAQTYLRYFAGPSGMLRAYRKSDGATFPCWPGDICHEPNGDIIPDFLSEPGYLGEYRAGFEPLWNSGVRALQARRLDMCDKLHLAGYWAQLMVCTPAWTRVTTEISNHLAIDTLSCHNARLAEMGVRDRLLNSAIEDLENGDIALETETDYVRASNARRVLNRAWALYNADWDVFENDTGTEYLTSDNPVSFKDPGETWALPGAVPFIRYLPVTPRLCLCCDLTRDPQRWLHTDQDFSKEPKGTINGGLVNLATVQKINTFTARCAENLVLTSKESDYARNLTARNARYRIVSEFNRFKESTRFVIANRMRCIESRSDSK